LTLDFVLFDLGGVVFDYAPERRWAEFARLTGESPETVRKRLQDSGYSRACDLGRLDWRRAHAEGVRLLGRRMSLEHFTEVWILAFNPNGAVVSLVQRLKAAASAALLTNNSSLVRGGLESVYPEVLSLFRPQLFSADLGLAKPDPRVFAAASNLLGSTPERVLVVDDAVANTSTARSLGYATHEFRDAAGLEAALTDLGLV